MPLRQQYCLFQTNRHIISLAVDNHLEWKNEGLDLNVAFTHTGLTTRYRKESF